MLRFTNESLLDVFLVLTKLLAELPKDEPTLRFEVLNPDISMELFSGESIDVDEVSYVYRSIKTWVELAEQLNCRMFSPQPVGDTFLQMRFVKLDMVRSWHTQSAPSGAVEKYGTDSGFFRIDKLEEPSFLVEYVDSLQKIPLPTGARILDAGINKGDEFALFSKLYPAEEVEQMSFVGIDHSASAIAHARERFDSPQYKFIEADLNHLGTLDVEPFDLIICIGTLHSASLDSRSVFRTLVGKCLKPDGHIILGFPNCRYIDHEVRYGAKMKNYSRPELSMMWKDVAFHKRYLQQHRFRVTLTGKHTIFLTAVRLPEKAHSV